MLVIRIQPDEGISLRMQAKVPGTSFRIESVKMDFHYGTSFGKASPEAYERLLLDAMAGDATLFARRDEVEQAWAFIDTIRGSVGGERRRAETLQLIRPARGDRRKRMNCWRAMGGSGGDCERSDLRVQACHPDPPQDGEGPPKRLSRSPCLTTFKSGLRGPSPSSRSG